MPLLREGKGPYSTWRRTRSVRITTSPPSLVSANNGTPATNETRSSISGQHVANRGLEEFIDLVHSIVLKERAVADNPTSCRDRGEVIDVDKHNGAF